MRSLFLKTKKITVISIFALTIVSALIYIMCIFSNNFAELFNIFTSPVRQTLSIITSSVLFSVFEALIIVCLIVFICLMFSKCLSAVALIRVIICFFSIYFVFFVFTIASGYYKIPIEEKMGLNVTDNTENELYNALILITNELNLLSNKISYLESGESKLPYDYQELSEKICSGYEKISFVKNFNTRVKPLLSSKLLSYARITGIYIPLTGEACINTSFPSYIVVSSASHEMAHQRGIAREDEAGFISFIALLNSNDDYLKYCAYLDAYSLILKELRSKNGNLSREIEDMLDYKINADLIAYKNCLLKYKNAKISKISEKINNSYLEINGDKNGIKSYDNISGLVVSYLISR